MTAELRRSSRSGAIGLLGAAVNGAFGFVLTTVIVRTFGAAGSGELFSVVGLVTIAGAVCCLGADTALMWALPRRPADIDRLLPVALLPTVAASLVVGAVGFVEFASLRWAFAGIPVIVASTVLLAAVRATRPIGAYVAVQLVFVPVARPLLMAGAVALGGGVLIGFAAWLLPLAVAAAIALALLARRPARPRADDWRTFWGFALPRAASVAIDASSMWVGVLLTAALSSKAEAGVFAAVGRYALAGLLIMQGLRVAVAPQLSRLLGAGRRDEAVRVYRRTTLWIVALSWPAYLLLAVFAPAFLALFGAQFGGGATPLVVLAAAMLVNVGVGLVQTVLLMSGNSRTHLLATVAGLALNVCAAVVLIPRHGALGAAIAWSLGIVAENVLAAIFARRALGAGLGSTALVRAAAAVTAATGAVAAIGVLAAGRGIAGLETTLGLLVTGCLGSLLDPRVRGVLAGVRREVR
jgi:O-antigen/teichoic acid export membrane protein